MTSISRSACESPPPCPGIWCFARGTDGALIRWRLPGGRLSTKRLTRLCTIAEEYGNGRLELTSRCNLQIRGLPQPIPSSVYREFADCLPVSTQSCVGIRDTERCRNILIDPFSGIDSTEVVNFRAHVLNCSNVLVRWSTRAAIGPKFSVVLDGGGSYGISALRADITVRAFVCPPSERPQACQKRARAQIAYRPVGWLPVIFSPEHTARAIDAVIKLVHTGKSNRMPTACALRTALQRHGARTWPLERALPQPRPKARGMTASRPPDRERWVHISLPPGDDHVNLWRRLNGLASRFGSGYLQLAPRREIIIPRLRVRDLNCGFRRQLVPHKAGAPRITACVGSRGCARARADVQGFAQRLVPHLTKQFTQLSPRAQAGSAPPGRGKPLFSLHLVACHRRCGYTQTEDALIEFDDRTSSFRGVLRCGGELDGRREDFTAPADSPHANYVPFPMRPDSRLRSLYGAIRSVRRADRKTS